MHNQIIKLKILMVIVNGT